MPRPAKGIRLWLRPEERNADGSIRKRAVWVIRDGSRKISTGCAAQDRDDAELVYRALEALDLDKRAVLVMHDLDEQSVPASELPAAQRITKNMQCGCHGGFAEIQARLERCGLAARRGTRLALCGI